MSEMAGNNAYNSTLLTGGMQALGYRIQARSAWVKNNDGGGTPWGPGATLSNSAEAGYWNAQWSGGK